MVDPQSSALHLATSQVLFDTVCVSVSGGGGGGSVVTQRICLGTVRCMPVHLLRVGALADPVRCRASMMQAGRLFGSR
jgi:hypothetical protein